MKHTSVLPPAFMSALRPVTVLAIRIATVVALPVLYLVEPLWRFRLILLSVDRIGNFSEDLQLYIAKLKMAGGLPPRTTHIRVGANPINRQLLTMFQRVLPINNSRLLAALVHYAKPILLRTRFLEWPGQTHDDHEEFQHDVPVVSFTAEEMDKGRKLLATMGVGPDDWFVCFHARDTAYAESRFPDLPPETLDTRARHRNADIRSFLEAAELIARHGGYAVRMGAVVAEPLPEGLSPRIIDYATKYRSDFGDIFLLGNCRFYLGSPSGLSSVCVLFGVPVATAHRIPLFPPPHGPRSRFIPRLLRRKDQNSILHFDEAKRLGIFEIDHSRWWISGEDFERANLAIEPSKSADIAELCQDMLDLTEGRSPTPEQQQIQDEFMMKFAAIAKSVRFAPRVGARFAQKYRHLIT